ncbi:protein kinase [Archangium violaceum]|uniref:protein kinase domain-containing protein n=1 Tax=Archangium violaceum TaxID=83451 RepID=UPI0019528F22|nr:protein kinase [Archangium violaceum]QRN97145.1 protein kinase [Archangium violaceum]
MSRDGFEVSVEEGQHTGSGGSLLEEAGSEDSFLRQVLVAEPKHRLPEPGERLGGLDGRRYSVLDWMGSGGMGQVFRARDEVLHREVALKFLLSRSGQEEDALREARAVARLDHENIVRIFDVCEWHGASEGPGLPFLVMECLEGESLAALLTRGPLDVGRALDILEGITTGLAHAHERHLVHRDLKPSNVFLTRQGGVKLLDFGLSHLTLASAGVAPHLPSSGTPAYMAPEQWRGEPQDARTDVWAAGAVLHEMLTGGLLHASDTLAGLRTWVTSPEPVPPVRTCRPEVPREVEALLATALAKEPSRRFRSALELREELLELRARLRPEGESPRTASPERRQVTLVAILLSGLAQGNEPLDAEDVGELETAFHGACAEVIERHGGSVTLSMGGEVLACFGHSRGREDDSERAVRAGLVLTRELRDTLRRALPHLPLAGLSVRGGIHTDLMAVGTRALQGEAPKVAAWLSRLAEPGGVVLGETSWKLVRGAFETEPLGSHPFERLSGPVRLEVHRVLREREADSRFARALGAGRLSPLVGREWELGRLAALWEEARRGRGAFVLVSGEAGLGKSRLIQELCERVAPESPLLLRVQCWSRFSTHALHPVIDLLQSVACFDPGESPPWRMRELEERCRAMELSREDTHLLGLLLALPVPEDSPVLQLTPEERKEKTFEALVRVMLPGARCQAPTLLVVEDLHWADSTLLEFLGFLLERAGAARLLVVLSARPELQPHWPRKPWLHWLVLERLPAGLAALLAKEVARERALPEETVQRLVSRTDGIPLFIEEMTRMVLEGGAEASIPVTLHELLLARLDLLPSRQKALAQLCAVVGRDFSRALLAALMEREDTPLERELLGLMEAGLLQEEAGAGGEPGYRFRHALIQEAAWQSLPRHIRRQHHRHIARVLEERFPDVGKTRPQVLAQHYMEAGEAGPAIRYGFRAGQLANQRSAFVEAKHQLEQARKLLPYLTDTRQRAREELHLLSTLFISLAHLHGVDSPELGGLFSRIRELFKQLGEELPRTELSYWALLAFAYARAEFDLVRELAGMLVDEGERQHSPELSSVGHRMMATCLFTWGQPRAARKHVELAVAAVPLELEQLQRMAMHHGCEPRTSALAFASVIESVLGECELARRHGGEALELAGRVGHLHTQAYAMIYVALSCQIRHDVRDCLEWAERAAELSRENDYKVWRAWAMILTGWCWSQQGRAQEGCELIREALVLWRGLGLRGGMAYNLGLLAESLWRLGRGREGLKAANEALEVMETLGEHAGEPELHRLRGELLRLDGREHEARRAFLHALEVARHEGSGLLELRAVVSLSRQLRDQGRWKVARRLLSRAHARSEAGGDSVDLREARTLLETLQAGRPGLAPRDGGGPRR